MSRDSFMYGTAWKKERTTSLVYSALQAGFRSIDTAAQPRHYREDLVAAGLQQAISEGIVKREDIFLQTKFTPLSGQDPQNLPYNPTSPLPTQITTSLSTSLTNFTYIDSLILHSPLPTTTETLSAWKTLESYVPSKIHSLGIANTTLPILQALFDSDEVKVKPKVVQNRFYADTGYDVELRRFCREKGVGYQAFWTLTANPELLRSGVVGEVGRVVGVEREVGLYALIFSLSPPGGMTILNGTTRPERMKYDLEAIEKVSD